MSFVETAKNKILFKLLNNIKLYVCKNNYKSKPVYKLIYFFIFRIDRIIQAIDAIKSEISSEILACLIENHRCENIENVGYDEIVSCPFCKNLINILKGKNLSQTAQNSLLAIVVHHEDVTVANCAKDILLNNMTNETARKVAEKIQNEKDFHKAINFLDQCQGNNPGFRNLIIDRLIVIALEEESKSLRKLAEDKLMYFEHYSVAEKERIGKALMRALERDPDPIIRANATWPLIFYPQFSSVLIHALKDENAMVRRKAAASVGIVYRISPSIDEVNKASEELLKLFEDEDVYVRFIALDSFSHIKRNLNDLEIFKLLTVLNDENNLVRMKVYKALARLEQKDALNNLNKCEILAEVRKHLLNETNEVVLAYAYWFMSLLDPKMYKIINECGLEDFFIKNLESEDERIRQESVDILGNIGTKKSLSFLKELDRDWRDNSKKKGLTLFYAIKNIEKRINRFPQ